MFGWHVNEPFWIKKELGSLNSVKDYAMAEYLRVTSLLRYQRYNPEENCEKGK